jgi:peptidoglycan hydrolase CwlO-like protein
MVKNILVLDDGTEIAAGTVGQNAILSLICTETVSKTTDLCPGAACSNKLEITIWVEPGTDLPITSGTRLTHYRETSGHRTLAGTYWAVKPTSQTRNTYKVYAYDAVSRLDSVQSTWLRSIQDQFPMTLWAFAGLVAQRCGVTIANNSLPRNGTYLVQAFYADNLTGRQLLAWVAEASCTFLRATPDGKIEFAWYTDYTSQSIGPTVYIRDGLSHDKFQTAPVVKVQIRQSDDDVGVLYPSDESGPNALVIQGNLLLTSATAEALKPVAQAIFETMQGVTYTPLKVTVPADFTLPAPGNIVSVTDARGNVLSSYIMTRKISGQQVTLESTGNATRDGTAAVNEQSYKNLTGKMLEIKTSVDGLEVKASDLTGKYTDLKATVDGLSAEVKKDIKITGGGNLILGSESFKNAELKGNTGDGSSITYELTGGATMANTNSNRYFRWTTVGAYVAKGVTLCLSVMYKPVSGADEFCMEIAYTAGYSTSQSWATIKPTDQLEIEQTDGWVLRYGLWTPPDNATLKLVDMGSGTTHAGTGNYTNKFSLLHPMLQYGNAPTAWNASSGDYLTQESAKSLFSQTADEIKTEVTKSVTETVTANVKDTATSAANDAVDSKLQDYATTATVNSLKEDISSISQKADSISTKVSSLEETTTTISNDLDSTKREFKTVKESVSAIDQKADSITQTVTQRITGGNNIIAGTDDWNNATLDAGGNDLRKKGTYTISGESVRVTNRAQNTRFHFGADKSLVIAKGMTYCASVLYKLNSGTDSLFLQFETKNSSGAKSYYGNAFKNAKQDIELDNGWKLRWAAFTATADGYADGLFISTADDNATVANDLTIMHPMVQMGNAPTAWTASTGDYLTANETKTEIKQTVGEIKLTASTSGTSSTIKLTAGGTEITSAQINLSGVVTFSDLSTWNQDKTIINGGNITTGQLHNLNYTTVYDLDNAWIRMGTEAGERVFLDNRHIAWYATINTGSIGLTGVLYSEAGRSYFGASSKYMSYGWVDGLNPTSYVGMQITYNRSDDSDADFNTTRVGVSGKLNVHNLYVWGSKSRVVPTSFGALKMAAFETPLPTFADWGEGQCGPEGWCLIALDPRYAETIAQYGQPAWLLTDCDGTGHLWAENCGQYAIVHGAPRQQFVWLCMAAQRGYEGSYADRSDSSYPAGDPAGIELAASTAARAQEAGTDVATELLEIDTGADETADILLDESERLT